MSSGQKNLDMSSEEYFRQLKLCSMLPKKLSNGYVDQKERSIGSNTAIAHVINTAPLTRKTRVKWGAVYGIKLKYHCGVTE